jgi:hypothetical protein
MSEETYAKFMGFWQGPVKPVEEHEPPRISLKCRATKTGAQVLLPDVWRVFPILGTSRERMDEHVRMSFPHENSAIEQPDSRPIQATALQEGRRVDVYDFVQVGDKMKKVVSGSAWILPNISEAADQIKRMQRMAYLKDAICIEKVIHPDVPEVCKFCHSMFPERGHCKLVSQSLGSMCSMYAKGHGKLVSPVQAVNVPYRRSLQYRLDQFEKRNKSRTLWAKSTLPTFNRNDGKFLGIKYYQVDASGEPMYESPVDPRCVNPDDIQSGKITALRAYKDTDPHFVPEKAFEHSRTEENTWFDDCAFPDEWREGMEVQEQDDHVYMDRDRERDVRHLSAVIQKPKYALEYRKVPMLIGFREYKQVMTYERLEKVWTWNAEKHMFTFTLEPRQETVTVKHEYGIIRKVELPTLVPVVSDSDETIVLNTSTVRTKREKQFLLDRSTAAKFKRQLTGYLIEKDALEAETGRCIPDPDEIRKELARVKA